MLQDLQRLEADKGKLQGDREAERRAREEAERKHSEVSQDRDKIHIDLRKMQGDKERWRLYVCTSYVFVYQIYS